MGAAAANTAGGAGSTVIVLDWLMVRPHASVNVQLSVTSPPHTPENTLSVDVTLPLIRHIPLPPFV